MHALQSRDMKVLHKIYMVSYLIFCSVSGVAQTYSLSGNVLSEKDKSPIEFALLYLSNNEVWAITNEKGEFGKGSGRKGSVACSMYGLFKKRIGSGSVEK